jgi:hypothetical protein
VLDQTISRARFSIALGRMDRAERVLAVQRVGLPADDVRVMPPHGMRQLDAAGKARLAEHLLIDTRSEAEDTLQANVARKGMVREVPYGRGPKMRRGWLRLSISPRGLASPSW